jgi:hypothetical protein
VSSRLLCLVVIAVVLAGCAGAPDSQTPPPPRFDIEWARLALDSEHDHADRHAHANLTTPNFRILGRDPLISRDYGTTVQGNLCGDAAATVDGRRLAVVESRGDLAFSLADVTDPAEPKWLGELVMRTTYVYDLAVVPDGRHVVLVTSNTKTADRPAVAGPADDSLWWRSPCTNGWVPVSALVTEDPLPRPFSLLLVSIEDPAAPQIVDQRPITGFGHSVSSTRLDGRTWIVASALACATGVGCPSPAVGFHFYELTDTPLGARLSPLSAYTVPMASPPATTSVGHNDAWIARHPGTGQTLAHLVAWDEGYFLLDMSDPRQPRLLGRWNDHDPSLPGDDSGNLHSAYPLPHLVQDRHYTIVGPELVSKPTTRPTGVVRVLDTTNPTRPCEAAGWTLPHDVTWSGGLMYSTHYLTAQNTTAFVSMYHGGVWALDLSRLGAPWHPLPSIGVFLPVDVSPKPPERPFRWAPTLQEVHSFEDGTLVTFDSNTGLYTFAFDATDPAPPPEPWPLTPGPMGACAHLGNGTS